MTRDFVTTLYGAAEIAVANGRTLKETYAAIREAMDPKFGSLRDLRALPAVQRLARLRRGPGHRHPVIWTAERDRHMWAALQA